MRNINIKCSLLGERGDQIILINTFILDIGKTSIISQYGEMNDPSELQKDKPKDDAVTYYIRNLEMDNLELRLHIWVISGDNKFRNLSRIFFRNSLVILLIYDICNKTSFENLKFFWYPQIQSSFIDNSEKILVVVGNKNDDFENAEISDKEGQLFANEINGYFMAVSAKTNNNIDNLFTMIGRKYLDRNNLYVPIQSIKENPKNTKKEEEEEEEKKKKKKKKKKCIIY